MLRLAPVTTWDPQRLSAEADKAFAGRVFQRTLTAWGPATAQDVLPGLAPDLATDTGKVSEGGRTWSFTLREDARWQDGRPVACADVQYGISRTFANTEITGGPTHAMSLLDVPRQANGSSTYAGPYVKIGQAAFDKAVSCSGQTITFKLARPVPDFNQLVALPAFGPVRADKDRGAAAGTEVYSNGPYMLQAPWTAGKGGDFVRNPYWSQGSDPVRRARLKQIFYREGVRIETAIGTIMTDGDEGPYVVTGDSAPPLLQNNIMSSPAIKALSTNPRAPFVDYLVPNFSRPTMGNLKARQALAVATNREAYLTAVGGASAAEPTYAMINKSLPAYQEFNPLGVPLGGDPARARTLLGESGLTLPVKITVAYRSGNTSDKAMVALQQGWEAAGFSVTLEALKTDYFAAIAATPNSQRYDVMWAVGSAEWPSGSSVIPSLFDSRLNLTATSSGQDYGRFDSPSFNAKIDAAARLPEATARERAWGDLDRELTANVAAIALTNQKSVYLHGVGVKDYINNQALGGTVDLATVVVVSVATASGR